MRKYASIIISFQILPSIILQFSLEQVTQAVKKKKKKSKVEKRRKQQRKAKY